MGDQGETYAAFVESELKLEYDRRASLDARAAAVVTVSSAFIGLVFAITAVVIGKEHKFTGAGAGLAVVSLMVFVAAAVVGLIGSALREYKVSSVGTLRQMATSRWKDTEVSARNVVMTLNTATIASLRAGNNKKAACVVGAFILQLVAVALLIAALGAEL